MTASTSENSTAQEILDVAEAMIRTGGYHAASYRDIAERVRIKSASVHYHFPTKEDLGAAVMRRYRDRTLSFLGDAADPARAPADLVRRYVEMFRRSLEDEGRVCLCGMFTIEAGGLPLSVREAALEMSRAHAAWLVHALRRLRPDDERARAERDAWLLISALQGALSAAVASGNRTLFEDVARALEEKLLAGAA